MTLLWYSLIFIRGIPKLVAIVFIIDASPWIDSNLNYLPVIPNLIIARMIGYICVYTHIPDIQFRMEWVYFHINMNTTFQNAFLKASSQLVISKKTKNDRSDRLRWEFHDSCGYQSPCVWHLLFEPPVTKDPFQYRDHISSYKNSHYKHNDDGESNWSLHYWGVLYW